jgi:hypothetical protein
MQRKHAVKQKAPKAASANVARKKTTTGKKKVNGRAKPRRKKVPPSALSLEMGRDQNNQLVMDVHRPIPLGIFADPASVCPAS